MPPTDVANLDSLPSPEVIDALISVAAAEEPTPGGIQAFDFRRPNKLNREHVRTLQIVNDAFARQLATLLSTTLRAVSQVSLAEVSQISYDDYVRTTANPSVLAIVSLQPLPGAGVLQIPTPLAMSVVDRLLGGPGSGTYPNRPVTDIETSLLRQVIDRILREFEESFESVLALEASIVQIEANPQFAQIAAPSDMVVVLPFDTRIGAETGVLSLCIPFASLQPALDRFATHSLVPDRGSGKSQAVRAALRTRLEDVGVPVSVRFDEVALRSADLLSLRVGDVLPLRHRTDTPLTVCVEGVPYLSAVAGRHGRRLACRIVDENQEQP